MALKILLLLLLIVSCGDKNDDGLLIKEPERACVDGHIYFYNYGNQYGGGYMSPKFDRNGKLIKCSMAKATASE